LAPPPAAGLHPLVRQVTERQLRSLGFIRLGLGALTLAMLASALWLGAPLDAGLGLGAPGWLEAGLGGFGLALLAGVVPLARRRLLDPARVQAAGAAQLEAWGLPPDVPLRVGRQAVYLTRYTAGCVVAWGLASAVGLYGLMAGLLGASVWVTGALFAAAAFTQVLLPPERARLVATLESFRAG
jgi:hypothetical protein